MSFTDQQKMQDRVPTASAPVAPPVPRPDKGETMMYYKTKRGKEQDRIPSLFNSKRKKP